jgi:CxxC-x17-CxxC domain-containing protein
MEETVRDAVFGNIGTLISFRVGAEDAEFLEKELMPEFIAQDIVNLAKYNIYLKLMIDGLAGRPFSASTLPPFSKDEYSNREKIIKVSREKYSTPRLEVEDKISRWAGFSDIPNLAFNPKKEEPVLNDAVCSSCGKPTRVVFKPDGKRPVYCKSCLKKVKQEEIKPRPESVEVQSNERPTISSLERGIKEETVSFKKKERKKVDLNELRDTLTKALKKDENENNKGL